MLPEKYIFDIRQKIIQRVDSPDWGWEEACEMGLAARNMRDLSNWILGFLAWKIEVKWGENSLGEFAKLLGFKPATLRQYRWIVKTFGSDYQPAENLPWSYYRLAAGTENPKETINNIVDQNYNYKQAERFVKGVPQPHECQHDFEEIKFLKCKKCGVIKKEAL